MLRDGVLLVHIRHGETDWNVEGRHQGRLDIPMNAHGRAQARRNAEALAGWFAAKGLAAETFAYVSSPSCRSTETMAIVRGALGLVGEAPTDARLMEVDFGDWSGLTYAELSDRGEDERITARRRDKWSFRPPRGETYAELASRVGAWLEAVTRDTVVTAHGGVYRVLNGLICGTPWHEVPSLPAPQDRVAVFRSGTLELV